MLTPWKESYDKPKPHIKKQRHYFSNRGPSSQSYGFSSSHVWIWGLDYKQSWALKNWCFWTVVLEKTLGSPLDCKEMKPVNPKGNQPWVFTGRTDSEDEAPILWPPNAYSLEKTLMLGKTEGRRRRGDRELDCWEASSIQWTWVWASSGSWWWIGKPGVLQSTGSQSQTQLSNWTELMAPYLYWLGQKTRSGFSHIIVQKDLNELFGQPNSYKAF